MNKTFIALLGIAGLSMLTPAMALADGLSISFSTGYPLYAAPVTNYHYVETRPAPQVIVIRDNDRHGSHERGHHFGHDRDRHVGHRAWHQDREEYHHNDYRRAGYAYSGYGYQPAPVIKRIDTDTRLHR